MAVISGSGTVAAGGQFHFGDRILVTCLNGKAFTVTTSLETD